MNGRCIAALLSFPLAAAADPFHASLSTGAGNAYDFLGLRAELRTSQFAIFGAIGPYALTHSGPGNPGQEHCPGPYQGGGHYGDSSFALGARFYFRPGQSTPYLGLQGTFRGTCIGGLSSDGDPPGFRNYLTFSATAGYRWTLGPLFVDAGVGPAVTQERIGYPGNGRNAGFVDKSLTVFHPISAALAFFELGIGAEF